MAEDTIGIPNASWWLNHSHVEIKEDLLAEDMAWIANNCTRVVNPGTQFARVEQSLGDNNILLVKRMVKSGVVAVERANGRVKTVSLPQDAGKLLQQDLEYIVEQINKNNAPMDEAQQQDFLTGADAPSETSLQTTN
jgi:hypothetical protein